MQEIDSAEFAEWLAYHEIEPFTVDRSEYILCTIAAILANVHRGKGTAVYKPEDFMPQYGKKKRDSSEDIETKLRAIFNGNN